MFLLNPCSVSSVLVQFIILNCTTLADAYRAYRPSPGATGQRLEETKKINQSLSALGTSALGPWPDRRHEETPKKLDRLVIYYKYSYNIVRLG